MSAYFPNLGKILIKTSSCYKTRIWVVYKREIIIFANSKEVLRATMYITKISEFSFNATLAKFFLSISFTCLVVTKALTIVYDF